MRYQLKGRVKDPKPRKVDVKPLSHQHLVSLMKQVDVIIDSRTKPKEPAIVRFLKETSK